MRDLSSSFRLILICLMLTVTLTMTTGAAKKVLTIHPWSSMGDRTPGGMMEQIVAEYEALNPDVEIEIIAQIPTYEFLMKLMLMGQMPDVVECHLGWFPELLAAGVPSPLPAELDAEARRFFFAPPLVPFTRDSTLYGIPTTYIVYALAYHQDLFDEIGLTEPPRTWAELEQVSRKGTKVDAAGATLRAGFSFPGAGWISSPEAPSLTLQGWLRSNGGYYIDAQGRPGLDRPEAVETLDYLTGLIRGRIAVGDGWGVFPKQTAFMAIVPNYYRPSMVQSMGESFPQVKTALIPRGKASHATAQFGWGYFVPKTALHPEEAWKFLQWYALTQGPDEMTRLGVAMARGYIPINHVDMKARRQQMLSEPFWEGYVAGMDVAQPEPPYPQIFKRWEVLGATLQPVIRLQVPPLEGLREAQTRIAAILAESTP
jgi:multiple sugar transport system substrate-binding protein